MKFGFLTAVLVAGAMMGCTRNVDEARKDLSETQTEAAQDVRAAQAEAVKDVNDVKEDAAADVRDAQRDLQKAETRAVEGTTSGFSRSAGDVNVSAEQCARFAAEKSVRPEDQALYEACARMDKDRMAK